MSIFMYDSSFGNSNIDVYQKSKSKLKKIYIGFFFFKPEQFKKGEYLNTCDAVTYPDKKALDDGYLIHFNLLIIIQI